MNGRIYLPYSLADIGAAVPDDAPVLNKGAAPRPIVPPSPPPPSPPAAPFPPPTPPVAPCTDATPCCFQVRKDGCLRGAGQRWQARSEWPSEVLCSACQSAVQQYASASSLCHPALQGARCTAQQRSRALPASPRACPRRNASPRCPPPPTPCAGAGRAIRRVQDRQRRRSAFQSVLHPVWRYAEGCHQAMRW